MKLLFTAIFSALLVTVSWSQKDVIQQIYNKAPKLKVIDFDSTFVTAITDRDTLEYTDVNALFKNEVKDTSEYSSKWLLMAINEMDSLKAEGDFQSYLNRLDIGMLANAEIYLIGKIDIQKNLHVIAWGVKYSTLEACPYGYGSQMFFTLVNKEFEVLNCVLAAEYSGGGDPPIFGWTKRMAKWNKDQLEIHQIDVEGEVGEDEEIIEKKEKELVYRFSSKGIQ